MPPPQHQRATYQPTPRPAWPTSESLRTEFGIEKKLTTTIISRRIAVASNNLLNRDALSALLINLAVLR